MTKRERSRDELPVQQMTKDRGKKAKKEYLKAFEFVLLSLGDEDEDEWIISDDKIMLRGLIQLSPESSEADIRRKLGEVTTTITGVANGSSKTLGLAKF